MKRISLLLSIIVLLVLLASCTEGERGLFWSIANETKIDDTTTLPNEISVSSIVESSSHYFIAAGLVYYREKNVLEWQSVAPPSGYANCMSLVNNGGTIYASFYNTAGTEGAIFTLNPAASTKEWSSSPVYDTNIVTKLFVVNGELFAGIQEGGDPAKSYSLLHYSSPNWNNAGVSGENMPIKGVIYDGPNTTYWAVSGSNVYNDGATNAPEAISTSVSDPNFSGKKFGGIFFYDGATDIIYLSTENGYIYTTVDQGTNWQESDLFSGTGGAIKFRDFIHVVGDGAFETIVVTTDGDGYFELPVDTQADNAAFSLTTPGGNYYDTDIRLGSVLSIYNDNSETPDRVLLGMAGKGFWRVSYTDTDTLDWKLE